MKKGQIESAIRRALNIFDKWNDVSGCFGKHTGYYYEMQGIIEDAVHCGIQEALQDFKELETEKHTDENKELGYKIGTFSGRICPNCKQNNSCVIFALQCPVYKKIFGD